MGWLETISSVLGTGAGGATIAGAIYAGAIALENEMRSEAKQDIARLINNTTINPDVKVTANFIFHAFETIFTSRHWSIACLGRSLLASCALFIAISVLEFLRYPAYMLEVVSVIVETWEKRPTLIAVLIFLIVMTAFAFIPDYISLFKGRLILRKMTSAPTLTRMCVFVILDIACSLSISIVFMLLFLIPLAYHVSVVNIAEKYAANFIKSLFAIFGIFMGKAPLHPEKHRIYYIHIIYCYDISLGPFGYVGFCCAKVCWVSEFLDEICKTDVRCGRASSPGTWFGCGCDRLGGLGDLRLPVIERARSSGTGCTQPFLPE
jgi:hypothetical protein